MFSRVVKLLLIPVVSGVFAMSAFSRPARTTPLSVEPGLEKAVKWKWVVEPSDIKYWGLELPYVPSVPSAASPTNMTVTPTFTAPAQIAQPDSRPNTYEVKRGDALVLIGKKFGVSV
ncbi:MAG: hypothetical protein ABIP97_08310, partial [Chthoniobacterales bacterium]